MHGSTKYVVYGVVAVAVLGFLAWFFRPEPPPPPPDGLCKRPAEFATVADRTLNLASAQIAQVAVGKLELKNDLELVQLLSGPQKGQLLFDYLICMAEQRGEVKPTDTTQMNYLRELYAFLSTGPTADQLARWQKEHAPPHPTARLETPDFEKDHGQWTLPMASASPVARFRLINSGDAPLQVWIGDYRKDRLFFAPSPGPMMISPAQSTEIELALLAGSAPSDTLVMKLNTNLPSVQEVVVKVADPDALAANLRRLAIDTGARAQALVSADTTQQALTATPEARKETVAAQVLATAASEVIRARYPGTSDSAVWALSGSLLEAVNWPQAAVEAYRRGRAVSAAASAGLELPLARALYFANASPNSEAREVDYGMALGALSNGAEGQLAAAEHLRLGASNPLVASDPQAAQRLVATLRENAAFARFSKGLEGDLQLAAGRPAEAVVAFDVCARTAASPSCQLRKAEAQFAARNVDDARRSLETMRATHADPASQRVATQALIHLDATQLAK